MKIALDSVPILILLAVPLGITLFFKLFIVAGLLGVLFICTCLFFRDPKRDLTADPLTIYAPADGTVLEIEKVDFQGEDYYQVVIFMSIFDVHINWIPFAGKILSTKYIPGKFLFASDKGVTKENERMEILMETEKGLIKFIQVAGFVARKIVCRLKEGQMVEAGKKFGLIKFGSRVDTLFSAEAEVLVKVGDKVKGGASVIGRF